MLAHIVVAMRGNAALGCEPSWPEVVGDIVRLEAPLKEEDEQILLNALSFKGRLKLGIAGDPPHSMSPEDMLKSLAVQALGDFTGTKHIEAMRNLETETKSSSLSCIIRAVIEKIAKTK